MVQSNLFPRQASNGKQPQLQSGEARPAVFPATPRIQQAPQPSSQTGSRMAPAAPATPSHSRADGRVRLSGRMGRYFDLKRTARGTLRAVFSIATAQPYCDPSGNWTKRTAWQRIVVWGEAAEAVGRRLRRGALVSVEGNLKTREWTDSEDRLHTTTELVAREVRFLDTAQDRVAA